MDPAERTYWLRRAIRHIQQDAQLVAAYKERVAQLRQQTTPAEPEPKPSGTPDA